MGVSYKVFKERSLYTQSVKDFLSLNDTFFVWNPFSASIEIILWFFFHFLMWYITFIDLCMLKHHYIPGINCTWSRYIILLMYSWIQFANILLRIFASVFIWDIGLYFSSTVFLILFLRLGNVDLVKMSLEVFPALQFYRKYPKEKQCKRMLKLLHSYTHLTY